MDSSYVHGTKEELEKYAHFVASLRTKDTILASEPNRRKIYCPGFQHQDVPILLTEFGGIGYDTGLKAGDIPMQLMKQSLFRTISG